MKLGTCMVLGTAGLVSFSAAVGLSLQGCSSSSSPGSTSGSGSYTPTLPPASPAGATAPTNPKAEVNFAVHKLMLGDANGGADWKKYGYDLDGLDTTASYTGACTPAPGASKLKLVDGPGGIDNSFGENIVPIISDVSANPSTTISNSLNTGSFTIMLDTFGLDSTTTSQTNANLTAQLFTGLAFVQGANTAPPTWTGNDNWPVGTSLLTNPNAAPPFTSKIQFTGAYIADGVWVSGAPATASLTLSIEGETLTVPVSHAIISFQHQISPTNSAVNGIIAGVIDAASLVSNLQGVAGNISTTLCGSGFQTIANDILQAADILDDGSNAAGTPCTGISIGIGFEADQIAPPSVIGTAATPVNKCADDGGTSEDSGGSGSGTGTGGDDGGTGG